MPVRPLLRRSDIIQFRHNDTYQWWSAVGISDFCCFRSRWQLIYTQQLLSLILFLNVEPYNHSCPWTFYPLYLKLLQHCTTCTVYKDCFLIIYFIFLTFALYFHLKKKSVNIYFILTHLLLYLFILFFTFYFNKNKTNNNIKTNSFWGTALTPTY